MKFAWVFPGQGSQIVGMGRDLYTEVPAAREVFDEADSVLDVNISRMCFEGPCDVLTSTENAQPALLAFSVALIRTLDALTPGGLPGNPAAVAGHSLGEYSALVAGGSLDLVTALRLVRRRGELMSEARQGTMAAVIGLEEQAVEAICQWVSAKGEGEVVIANYNAPGQLVISGTRTAVECACVLAKEHGAKRAIPLKVSGAFHSPLMKDAAAGLASLLAAASIAALAVPLVANVTAKPLTRAEEIRNELLEQIVSPVRWVASVQHMVAQGVSTFIEIGPGNVLTSMIKRISPEAQLVNLRNLEDVRAFVRQSQQENDASEQPILPESRQKEVNPIEVVA